MGQIKREPELDNRFIDGMPEFMATMEDNTKNLVSDGESIKSATESTSAYVNAINGKLRNIQTDVNNISGASSTMVDLLTSINNHMEMIKKKLTPELIPFDEIFEVVEGECSINTNWPRSAIKYGNIICLNVFITIQPGAGTKYAMIKEPYLPAQSVYLFDNGNLINTNGDITGYRVNVNEKNLNIVYITNE